MPTLAQLGSANPTLITIQSNQPVIEPLDGPTAVDDVMDRFPAEIYHQGRDTHLYRFLQALGGDAGVGLVKKFTFNTRLFFEAESLSFQALDAFFAGQFNLPRLRSEAYPDLDPTGALTPDQWDQVLLADQSYKQRVIEFFTATRRGNSPEGLRIMAQAGAGIECDLIESYKWIFDLFSDDPLGLNAENTFLTTSTAEFQIIPRFLNLSTDIYDEGFEQTLTPFLDWGSGPFPNTRPALGGTAPHTDGYDFYPTPQTRLVPEIERNVIDLLDRLKPVGTLATIIPEDTRFIEVPVAGDVFATSTRINTSRFVTGKAGVPWPAPTSKGNFFIESGVEKEAGYYYGAQRDLPVIFQTIENVHAYTEQAFADPSYGTNDFFDASSGISPFEVFRSEFTGHYDRNMTAIFPFLIGLDPSNTYAAIQALAAQDTPLVLEGRAISTGDVNPDDVLVNSMYPTSYFSLPGVDPIKYPDNFWWGSRARFASTAMDGVNYQAVATGGFQTSEVLEIDLGRVREVNYMNFDVLAAPINITIEYDDISTPDREAVWLPVQAVEGLPFDRRIVYNADSRTGWFNGEYNFADSKGNMIHTRYLRVTFTRRDEAWPTSASGPFAWPVLAKHLRAGRYISSWIDTQGPLLTQDTPLNSDAFSLVSVDNISTREARQQFVLPLDAPRGNQIPHLIGFGVLVQTNTDTPDFDQSQTSPVIRFQWSVWDVTIPDAPVQLRSGVEEGVVTPGLSWLDWYLEGEETLLNGAIVGDLATRYELRIASITAPTASTVFTSTPETISTRIIPGVLDFSNGSSTVTTSEAVSEVLSVGDYIVNSDLPEQSYVVDSINDGTNTIVLTSSYGGTTVSGATALIVYPFSSYDEGSFTYVPDGSKNLVCRVWADVADSGRDVLGNTYRYGTRRELPNYVTDGTRAGWMCEPNPAPNAVEALYFDVRAADADSNPILAFIDAVRIAPRTPGVQMNVYYSQQGLIGHAPNTEGEWDFLLWHPIQASYILRRSEVIQLPHQVQASFIKLEFTNLNPAPFRVPTFPPLPPREFKTYPQWVLDRYAKTTTDPFIQAQTPVQFQALDAIVNPTYEFNYDQRNLLSQLALGTVSDSQVVSAGLASVAGASAIDTTTAKQVFVSIPDQYKATQLVTVKQANSLLGKVVVNRFDPSVFKSLIEGTARTLNADIPFVSTVNDRLSQAYQGIIPNGIKFNEKARHSYDVQQAIFNKKAYFVGIDEVQFLRNNYLVKHDDDVIDQSILDPDGDFVFNDWIVESGSTITDGATIYVSYAVNPSVSDEAIVLNGFVPVELATIGGPAFNVKVFSSPQSQGLQYFQGQDYDLIYGFDLEGNRTTSIMRSPLGARLTSPVQTITYTDAATVIGHTVIPSPPTDDAGTVTGIAAPVGDEGPFVPNFGSGTFGGGTFGDLTKQPTDSGEIDGVAVPSAAEHESGLVHPATIHGTSTLGGTVTKI